MATVDPRTMLHSTDLDGDDFAFKDGKIVSKQGLAGPYQILEGTIADYENQSGKPELVWIGGTESEPSCVWIVFPDDVAIKIKVLTPGDDGFCEKVVDCVGADLALGSGTPEKYRIPEMVGPTWIIASVTYGESNTEVSFASDAGTNLESLVSALNGSTNLPEDWSWEILTGALALVAPYGTGVTKVTLDGGTEVPFAAPTVTGSPSSELADSVVVSPVYFGSGSAIGSINDTEAEIESEFSLMSNVTVRWTDSDGDPRISYKTTAGWYHPADKAIAPVVIYQKFSPAGESASNVSINTGVNVSTVTSGAVPADARFVYLLLSVLFVDIDGASGESFTIGAIEGADSNEVPFHYGHTHAELNAAIPFSGYHHTQVVRIPISSTLTFDYQFQNAEGHSVTVEVSATGWVR